MCGRYYVDDETAEEIEKVIRLRDPDHQTAADTLPGTKELCRYSIHRV